MGMVSKGSSLSEADACVLDSSTANKFSCGSLAEQCGVQTTSCASQTLSDRSPTKNTLAFGFYITPHCDSGGDPFTQTFKAKAAGLGLQVTQLTTPKLRPQVPTTDAASQGSLLLTQRTGNGSFEKG